MTRLRSVLLAALPVLGLACASARPEGSASPEPSDASRAVPPAPPAPWTSEFQSPRLLVADEIRIEGPPGLFEHFAVRVEPAYHDRQEETTPQGYLQVVSVRPDAPAEIRAYLDRLELAALRRLTVLERPGEVPVAVLAAGDVYLADPETGAEQRVPELRLVGRRPTGPPEPAAR